MAFPMAEALLAIVSQNTTIASPIFLAIAGMRSAIAIMTTEMAAVIAVAPIAIEPPIIEKPIEIDCRPRPTVTSPAPIANIPIPTTASAAPNARIFFVTGASSFPATPTVTSIPAIVARAFSSSSQFILPNVLQAEAITFSPMPNAVNAAAVLNNP